MKVQELCRGIIRFHFDYLFLRDVINRLDYNSRVGLL